MKLLPSEQVQYEFGQPELRGFDGEITEGDITDYGVFNRSQSYVMSADKIGGLTFSVFDHVLPASIDMEYYRRLEIAENVINGFRGQFLNVKYLEHKTIDNEDELLAEEERVLDLGYEGVMLRNPFGRAKLNARCTINDAIIWKLKRFVDAEGRVIGFEEGTINTNEQLRDERGYAKRSKAMAGLVPSGMVGKFLVEYEGQVLKIGPGCFSHAELIDIWNNQPKFTGDWLKFRFFSRGSKNSPRQPIAVGWRSTLDF